VKSRLRTYSSLRSLKSVIEHFTFEVVGCPRVRAILRAAKMESLTSPKKKATILTIKEVLAEYQSCPLILGARVADMGGHPCLPRKAL
jgi:hypothetical protein